MKFSALDLAPQLQQALDACGYSEMTPVQQKAIVPARRGKDLLANAQTGTGKTAAFALPILQQICDKPKQIEAGYCRAVILTPTRELAEQLSVTINRYAQFLDLKISAHFGGVAMDSQKKKLKRGVDILIATPGRLLEHLVQCNINLSRAEFVVLDEADRMLDMGFVTDVATILRHTPEKRQTMLFSATLSPAVHTLSKSILTRHIDIRAAKLNAAADTIEHVVYPVEERRKADLFSELIHKHNWFQVLVFTSTKAQADALMRKLKTTGVTTALCHGDKTQGTRRRALADFKSAKIQVLIATEVAARGLDIPGLEYVVNYNLPYLAEDYVHRIGRTGRAGNKGYAISFVSREEERALDNIEKLINAKIKRVHMPGYDVGNRETLRKNISKGRRLAPSNKATHTKIMRRANGPVKVGRKKTTKR
ncbi:MAG: DEAD/DEAH box helicase [Pseudomonadales bacterium]|nr:DEAD/DEAH box helicase [Pseudomonadales bacterium]NRA18793.1 DEAD/DEAH box helicase [Oceanospirillaceae bacterium]